MEIVVAHQDGGVMCFGRGNGLADFVFSGGKFDVYDVDNA